MTTDGREQVWRAVITLAGSASYLDRSDAARCLVLFAGIDEVDCCLLRLARDPENTYVTEATVEALTRRGDEIGWRLVVRAFEDEVDGHNRDHMIDGIESGLGWDWTVHERARDLLRGWASDAGDDLATGAAAILEDAQVFRPPTAGPAPRVDRWRRRWRTPED